MLQSECTRVFYEKFPYKETNVGKVQMYNARYNVSMYSTENSFAKKQIYDKV